MTSLPRCIRKETGLASYSVLYDKSLAFDRTVDQSEHLSMLLVGPDLAMAFKQPAETEKHVLAVGSRLAVADLLLHCKKLQDLRLLLWLDVVICLCDCCEVAAQQEEQV